MSRRTAFTMLELIFVIVIMGILGKFGVEFLMNAYENYFYSTLQNRLQQQSEAVITQIAARLQYRVKGSILSSNGSRTLRWIGADIEGWRGTWNVGANRNVPTWSGFINLDTATNPNENLLTSPQTNTATANTMISALSNNLTGLNNSAIFFTGATRDASGVWDAYGDQSNELAHPINSTANAFEFAPFPGDDFTNVDVYEFYQLAWSAYTVDFNRTGNDELTLFYDYQPWQGENDLANGLSQTLMDNVQSFQYWTIGDVIKVQVCVTDKTLVVAERFSVCKEKTIF